jgi:hypothetical protein
MQTLAGSRFLPLMTYLAGTRGALSSSTLRHCTQMNGDDVDVHILIPLGVSAMNRKHLRNRTLLALGLSIAGATLPAFAQTQSKWFVLRNHEAGNCWTATLIQIDGQYINSFERKAGGPYDTEAHALERQRALEIQGTCQPG